MSDAPSIALMGLSNPNLNSGDLLDNAATTTSEESTESFSNLFNEAQNYRPRDPAEGRVPAKERTDRLSVDSEAVGSSDNGEDTKVNSLNLRMQNKGDGTVRRSIALGVEDVQSILNSESVERENDASITGVESSNLAEQTKSATTDLSVESERNEHALTNPESLAALSTSQDDVSKITPELVKGAPTDAGNDYGLAALPPSQGQDADLEATPSLGGKNPLVDSVNIGLIKGGSTLNPATGANEAIPDYPVKTLQIEAQKGGHNISKSDEPLVVSAATVANRLNKVSEMPVGQKNLPTVTADSKNPLELNAKQVSTFAGIQSVQAGILGAAQSSKVAASSSGGTGSLQIPAMASASAIDQQPNISLTGNGDSSNILPVNQVAKQAGPVLTTASLNDTSTMASTNSLLDNMLSTAASGIVTAPITAKVEGTGPLPAQTPLNVPLLTPAAPDALAGNVRWMIGEGVQNAVVNVSPAGMGPISVQIGLEKEQMSISIIASQSSTREALESLLPRLRDQLGTQAVESIRVDISDGRGDRSGNSAGNERQNMSYATTDNQTGSQHSNSDAHNAEQRNGQFEESQVDRTGERALSASEQAQVDEMRNNSSYLSLKNLSISHGYDLYV